MGSVIRSVQLYLKKLAILIVCIAAGCSFSELPFLGPSIQSQRILDDTPFFPQEDYQCGPAALAMVLTKEGISVKPAELTSKVYLPARKGSLQIEMNAAIRSFGLIPYSIDPSLKTLIQQLEAGKPVLVLQNLSLESFPKWHYAVVIGYDLDTKFLYLRSGGHKKIKIPFVTFQRTWVRADNWGIIVLKPGESPVEADYQKFLKAVYQMEQIGQYEAAESGYETIQQLWPQQTASLFALGNLRYQRKDHQNAIAAFRKAVEIDPDFAQAWNNLALTLKIVDRTVEALVAIEMALSLNPNSIAYQNSYREITAAIATSAITK